MDPILLLQSPARKASYGRFAIHRPQSAESAELISLGGSHARIYSTHPVLLPFSCSLSSHSLCALSFRTPSSSDGRGGVASGEVRRRRVALRGPGGAARWGGAAPAPWRDAGGGGNSRFDFFFFFCCNFLQNFFHSNSSLVFDANFFLQIFVALLTSPF